MPSLSDLFVTLSLKSDQFISGLRDSQREAKEFDKAIKPLSNSLKDIGGAMEKVGIAATVVGAPFALMAKSAIDNADALSKMSERTGLTTETLSALKQQASLADVSMESLGVSLKKQSVVLENATSGNKQAQESFAKLRLSVTDLLKLSPDERFFAIARAIESVPDPAIKAGLAMEVWGKSGTELFTLLPSLSGGIDEVVGSAKNFNQVITAEGGQAAKAFNDSLTNLKNAVTGLFNVLANSGLLQTFTDLINKIAGAVAGFGQAHPVILAVSAVIGGLAAVIGPVVAGIGFLVSGIGAVLGPIGGFIASAGGLAGILGTVVTILTGPVGIVAAIAAGVIAVIAFRNEIGGALLKVLAFAVDAFGSAAGIIAKFADSLGASGIGAKLHDFQFSVQETAVHLRDMSKGMTAVQAASEGTATAVSTTSKGIGDLVAKMVQWNGKTHEQIEAEQKAAEAAKKFQEAITSQVNAVKGNTEQNKVLVATLTQLEKEHVSMQLIVEKLGKATKDYAKELELQGKAIPPIVAKVADATVKFEDFNKAMEKVEGIVKKNNAAIADYVATGQAQTSIAKQTADAYADYARQVFGAAGELINLNGTINQTIKNSNIKILATVDPQAEKNLQDFLKKTQDAAAAQQKALDDAVRDVGRSAGHIFDDMVLKGQNVFTDLGSALKGGALSLGRSIFEDVTGQLLGPVKLAFDEFFKSLLESTGIKAFISGLGEKLGGLLSGVFGFGGGAASVVSSVAGGATSGAGAVTSAAGTATGTAGSLTTGLLGGVAGGVISGLGSFFGSMRLEGTMNAVEYNTRASEIHLRVMLGDFFNSWDSTFEQIKNDIHEQLLQSGFIVSVMNSWDVVLKSIDAATNATLTGLDSVSKAILESTKDIAMSVIQAVDGIAQSLQASLNALQPATVPRFASGGVMPHEGLAYLEAGEVVSPPGRSARTSSQNVEAPPTVVLNIYNQSIDSSDFERVVRTKILPEFQRIIDTNYRGARNTFS